MSLKQSDEAADVGCFEIDDFGDIEGKFDDGNSMPVDILAEVMDGAVDIAGEFGGDRAGGGEIAFGFGDESGEELVEEDTEDIDFRAEVVVDHGEVDGGVAGDFAHAGGGEAFASEEVGGGVEDFLAG